MNKDNVSRSPLVRLAGTILLSLSIWTLPPALCLDRIQAPPAKSYRSIISAEGRIEQSANTSFHVHAMLPGRICEDHAVIGKYYRRGELLALMESAELVRQSAEYLLRREQLEMSIRKRESAGRVAKSDLARIRKLVAEGIAAEKDLTQAEEDARTATEDLEDLNEQRLRLENECQTLTAMYGIKLLDPKQQTEPSQLPIRAPNNGVVATKNVSLGDRVNPDEAAYVMTAIAERQRVDVGQQVSFSCRQLPKKVFVGSIDNVTFSNDPLNQDFSVSATLKNPRAVLRPGMIGQARISVK
jgi:multidrug efflux pump subunit AcrA (membrane-fusion protein)